MGIPGFNIWFSEEYAKAYVPLGKVRVDHLYIDLNSVLHTVIRRAKNHGHFHKALHKRLNQILETTQPQKSVMIAVDGPAPLAKLLTQRDRRKKTGRSIDAGETLTGAAITPGTTFMLDLTHSLTYFCCTKLSSRRFRNLVFELSDGTVMGEGEVKVLGRLARHWYPSNENDTHVILGDDADLILMALTSYKENLFVANSGLNDGRLDARVPVFSVNLLHAAWASSLLAKVVAAGQVPLEQALLHAKLDLTLIAIMSKGNDYLPGVRGVGLEVGARGGLWNVYQAAASKYGSQQGRPVGPLGDSASVTSLDPDTGTPRLHAGALARLLKLAGGSSGGGDGSGEWLGSKASANPRSYLRGCVWLLQMYLTGECPDYRFYYDGVAPSVSVLCSACEGLLATGQTYITLDTFGAADPRASQPLLPVACALALLPANCQHLAAPCVRHLMAGPGTGAGAEQGQGGAAAAAAFDRELYSELYGVCDECREMATEVARLQRAIADARAVRAAAAKRLDAVSSGTAPLGEASEEQLEEEVAAAERDADVAKSQYVQLERRRKQHVTDAHPYRRFPVERLEAAAEAVLAAGNISQEERPATSFGRPHLLRAFDSPYAATSFIRTQAAAGNPQQQQQHQQLRHASSWSAGAHGQRQINPNAALYSPPPPPFDTSSAHYFASIVRQEVLYDEYGSPEGLQLRLAPSAPGEAVRYLVSTGGSEQGGGGSGKKNGPQQQVQQRQPPRPQAAPQQQRQPETSKPPPAKRQELEAGFVAAAASGGGSGERPGAAAAAVPALPAPTTPRPPATPAAPAPGASQQPPGGQQRRAGAGEGEASKRRRGRAKGSKGKAGGSNAASDAGGGGNLVGGSEGARPSPIPVGPPPAVRMANAAAAAVAVASVSSSGYGAPPAPPPPMPSSRLIMSAVAAATAAGGGGRPAAPPYASDPHPAHSNPQRFVPPHLRPQGQHGQYGQYGPFPYGQRQYSSAGLGAAHGNPGGAGVVPAAPRVALSSGPIPYRPSSPSPSAAAAAMATASGRGRAAGPTGPRWN